MLSGPQAFGGFTIWSVSASSPRVTSGPRGLWLSFMTFSKKKVSFLLNGLLANCEVNRWDFVIVVIVSLFFSFESFVYIVLMISHSLPNHFSLWVLFLSFVLLLNKLASGASL